MEIKEAFDVIKETKEDFKNVLLERLRLPIINYYIFFLIIYNWDIIVMLFFFKGNAELRIEKVKNLYENYNFLFVLNWRMLVPLIYSFISCMIFPYVSSFIERKLKSTNENRIKDFFDLEEEKAKREKDILFTRNGNKTITQLIDDKEKLNIIKENLETDIRKLEVESSSLKTIKLNLDTEIDDYKTTVLNLNNQIYQQYEIYLDLIIIDTSIIQNVSKPFKNNIYELFAYILKELNNDDQIEDSFLINVINLKLKDFYINTNSYFEDSWLQNDSDKIFKGLSVSKIIEKNKIRINNREIITSKWGLSKTGKKVLEYCMNNYNLSA
ncbi:hypothetical protein HX001_17155 [Empedobacter brevis]|uniref:Uncharacterized protein n=1 Tax=Empedobacter brevis TaxID=247 RepID=A0AAJ1QHU7_9FLAO|nr:hypothetical protein [Empedobacter brevis]MDM1074216.1 hypothetical protein [Empedobacter brevis]